MGKQVAGDTTPPVYLGPRQLDDLDNLRIIDDGRRSARVYLAGDIKQLQISTIADKLAVAGVKEARLFKGITDREPEKWNMDRLRDAALRGESPWHAAQRRTSNRRSNCKRHSRYGSCINDNGQILEAMASL